MERDGGWIRVNAPHPSREEGAVLELAQVEGDEEGSGHEDQGEQRGVGLVQDRRRHGAVAQSERDICRRGVCAVAEGATSQRVLVENLADDTEGSN